MMRQFYLWRKEDVSGVSGTGKVGEGVAFDNGRVVFQWTTAIRSVVHYDSMAELEKVHGHEGRTVWKHMGLPIQPWQIEMTAKDQPPRHASGHPGLYTTWHSLHRVQLFLDKLWEYIDGTQVKGSIVHSVSPTSEGGLHINLLRVLAEGTGLQARVIFDWAGDISHLSTWVALADGYTRISPQVYAALCDTYEAPYFGIGLAVKLIGEHFLYELPEEGATKEGLVSSERVSA